MKKYQKPVMVMVSISVENVILAGSEIYPVDPNGEPAGPNNPIL